MSDKSEMAMEGSNMSIEPSILSLSVSGLPEYKFGENLTVHPVSGSTGILLSTLWNQSGIYDIGDNTTITYNEYCPLDPKTNTHSVTGCTNTAAGQIIYYFIEKKGLQLTLTLNSSDEYTSSYNGVVINIKADGSTPGTLSFTAINEYLTSFQVDSAEHAAALVYACGVVQRAGYSSNLTGTAWDDSVFYRSGFTSVNFSRLYWGGSYWGSEIGTDQYTFTDEGFEVLIENLEAGRPVGASIPGHAIVIDGYNRDEDKFHLNYGWGKYASTTRWYTREEMRAENFDEFFYDLRIDYQETFTVSDSRVYGIGTMVRAIEQANGMIGENTVVFDSSVAGQQVELMDSIELTDDVQVRNFNMDILIPTSVGSSWGYGFNTWDEISAEFKNFSGSLIVDTEKTTNVGFYFYYGSSLSVETDHALIYSGRYAVNSDYSAGAAAVLSSLKQSQNNHSAVEDFLVNSRSYSFYGSSGDDVFSLDNGSIAVGNTNFSNGDDTLVLANNSHLYGDVNAGNGNDTITIDSSSSITGCFYGNSSLRFNLGSAAEHAIITVTTNVSNVNSNVTVSVDISEAELGTYILFAAASGASYASSLNQIAITVTGSGEADYVLSGNGTSTSSYADLIYENNMLKFNLKEKSSITTPKVVSVTADTTAPTNQDVTLTAVFNKNTSYGQYSLDGSTWQNYDSESGVSVSANGIVYFRAVNADGDISEIVSYEVNNIDKTAPEAPTASADITTPTNQSVTVSAVYSEDSVTKQYSLDGQNWLPYTAGIVINENGNVYFRGMDAAGNISPVTTFKVTNIDKTAPEKPTVTADITVLTNKDVTLTAVFSEDTATKQYSMDGQNWQNYPAGGLVVTENCTVFFRAIDEAGNISDVTSYEVTNIVKTKPDAPTVSADITSPTNKDVTLTAVYGADIVTKQYSLDGENWQSYPDGGVVVPQNCTVYFRGIDEAGNISETTSFEVNNIDKTAPEKPVVSADITTETTKDVTLTAVFSEDTATKQYSMDGQNWQNYPDGGLVVTENCTVYFRGIDEAGNISDVTSYEVTNIVKTKPDAPTVSADITALTNKDVTLTAVYSEELTTRQYSLDGEIWQNYPAGGVVVTENRTVYFRGIDAEGTVSKVAQYAVTNIDKVPPEKPAVTADITTVTNKDVTLTAVFSPDAALKQYSKDGKNWQDYPGGGVVVTENCSVYFRAQDEAGNLSDVVRYDVTNIDKTIPDEPSVSADITAITNQDVTLTAVYSEDTVTKQYSMDGKKWLSYPESGVVVTENCTVYFRGINAGGTASAVKAWTVSNIDKTAPEKPSVTADVTTQTDSEVKLTAVYSADTVTKQYSLDGSNWEPYTGAVVVTENCTVFFRGKDEAGNISDVTSYQVGNIVPKVVPGEPVKVFSSGRLFKTGKTLTGVTLEGKSTNSMFIYSGGEARNTNINSAGRMYVSRGGLGMDTRINAQGVLYVSSGGAVSRTMVNSGGRMQVSSGGKAVSTTVHSSGLMYVSRGGSASGTVVASLGGLYASGGSVVNTDIRNGGRVYITSGGFGSGTVLSAGSSYLFVSNGGTAESTTVQSGGRLQAGSGGILSKTDIRGGELQVLDQGFASSVGLSGGSAKIAGGSAVQVTVQSGKLYVSSGGVADGVSAGNGAQVYVGNGGKLTGRMTFNAGATVKVTGGTVDFNISEAAPGSAALVNKLALVTGTPAFTITVSATQADGLYILAAGAAGFRDTVQISTDSEYLGVLTPDGSSYMLKDVVYSLAVSGSNLQLSVQTNQTPDLSITVNADRTDATSQPVTVSAVFGKDAAMCEYSLDNRTWQDYTDGIVMTENRTVYFRARNAEGIYSEVVSYEVTNIDKAAPVINSISGYDVWSEDSIVIIVRATDSGSGVEKTCYTFNGSPWTEFDGSFTVDRNGPFMIKAVDYAGNETLSKVLNVKRIGPDTEGPVISNIRGNDAWNRTEATVIADITDSLSGVAKAWYTFNGSPWTEFDGSFTVDRNGPFMIKAVDYAGNETLSKVMNVKNLGKTDTDAPVIESISGYDVWSEESVVIIVRASDAGSGVAKTCYTFNGSPWTEFSGSFTLTENGPFMVKAVDYAGNETVSPRLNVKVIGPDTTGPEISNIRGNDAWNQTTATVTADITDSQSGVAKMYYTFSGSAWTEFDGSFTVDRNGPFMIRAVDNRGNETLSKVMNVKNLGKTDSTAPVIESISGYEAWDPDSVTVKVTVSDTESGPGKTWYTFNGTPWTEFNGSFTITENGPFMIKAQDMVGNETLSKVLNVKNVGKTDTEAPVIESITWDKTPTSGPVTVTAVISDSLSGIGKTYYTFNGTPWTEFDVSFTVTQNGPFMIKAVDKTGNEALSPVRNITNITPPQEAASALCGEELESWNSPLFPAGSSAALLLPEAVCGSLTDALAGCDPLTQAGCCPESPDLRQQFGNTGSVYSALLSGSF